jgi:hypothetical protein
VKAYAWEWDESLYAGSAAHYATGRMPYPPGLAEVIRDEFEDDLRDLLKAASPDGRFSERTREIAVVIWRP